MTPEPGLPHDHPPPHRGRASVPALLFALAIGPAAWAAQLMIGYGVSSYACFPSDEPFRRAPPPGWSGERPALVAVDLVCLGLALAGVWMAQRSWRAAREESGGRRGARPEIGVERSLFLAGCGVVAGLGFALAILFDLAAALGVPSCWDFGR